jgi:hypothetical protein
MGNVFIYLSFGGPGAYQQCLFSLLSLCHFSTGVFKVFVVTDSKQFFEEYTNGLPVDFIQISEPDIRAMRGEIDFIHRIKIAAIERVMEHYPEAEAYLYIDSDTIVRQDLSAIASRISDRKSIMHLHEFYFPDTLKEPEGNLSRRLYEAISRGEIFYYLNGSRLSPGCSFSSWNAGVIGISRGNKQLLSGVYSLTDGFYKAIPHHAAEQFAFSYLLEKNTAIETCEKEVIHYWRGVQKGIAAEFFMKFFEKFRRAASAGERRKVFENGFVKLTHLLYSHVSWYQANAIYAFCENNYIRAYSWAFKAIMKNPLRRPRFILDVFYYTKLKCVQILKGK